MPSRAEPCASLQYLDKIIYGRSQRIQDGSHDHATEVLSLFAHVKWVGAFIVWLWCLDIFNPFFLIVIPVETVLCILLFQSPLRVKKMFWCSGLFMKYKRENYLVIY